MYADFRTDFTIGLNAVLDAILRVTNANQGCVSKQRAISDWAADWGYDNRLFRMQFTIVQTSEALPFTLLTEVTVRCNKPATRRYEAYVAQGLAWQTSADRTPSGGGGSGGSEACP